MGNMHERRNRERSAFDGRFQFTVNILDYKSLYRVQAAASGVDLSDDGMGFVTDVRLEPGHVLKVEQDGEPGLTAMVRWVEERDGKFRVGASVYK